jgi:hypothetical protein
MRRAGKIGKAAFLRCSATAGATLVPAHDPEKSTGFSDKIMRKDKKIESKIASM